MGNGATCRWLIEWGVAVASEGKMRREAATIVGDNTAAEVAPFTPSSRDNTVVKPAPFVYVPRLWEKIQSVLEQNIRSVNTILVYIHVYTCTYMYMSMLYS